MSVGVAAYAGWEYPAGEAEKAVAMVDGLVMPDGTFRSKEEVCADLARQNTSLNFTTPVHHPPDSFDWWQERAIEAKQARREAVGGSSAGVRVIIRRPGGLLFLHPGSTRAYPQPEATVYVSTGGTKRDKRQDHRSVGR